jgi:stage III sporulation protein AE
MIPVLTSLLLSTGNISSAAIFQPTILFIVQTIGSTVKYFSIPIIFFSLALSIANNVSDKFKVNKMSEFLKQINKWVLGILLTIFVGVITIQGFTSSVLDGISTKTAKYAVGNMVPVFGGLLSDAVDTVIGCSLILKNAVGIAGLIAIIVLVAVPMLKIMALIAVYRFTTALVEPISDKRIVNCIGECANTLSIVFVLVAIVAVMFIISITIMISAANISAMFR